MDKIQQRAEYVQIHTTSFFWCSPFRLWTKYDQSINTLDQYQWNPHILYRPLQKCNKGGEIFPHPLGSFPPSSTQPPLPSAFPHRHSTSDMGLIWSHVLQLVLFLVALPFFCVCERIDVPWAPLGLFMPPYPQCHGWKLIPLLQSMFWHRPWPCSEPLLGSNRVEEKGTIFECVVKEKQQMLGFFGGMDCFVVSPSSFPSVINWDGIVWHFFSVSNKPKV